MSTMQLSLPDALRAFVDAKAADGGFETGDAYVRELIRREHDRERLRQMLLEGADSGPGREADDAFFDELRALSTE